MGLFGKKDPAEKYFRKGYQCKYHKNKPEKALYYYRKAIELGHVEALEFASFCLYPDFPRTRENLEQAAEWQWQYILAQHQAGKFIDRDVYSRWVRIWAELCKLLGQTWGSGTMEGPWQEMLALLTAQAQEEEKKRPADLRYFVYQFLIDLYLKGAYEYFPGKFASIRETYEVWIPDEERGFHWLHMALQLYEKKKAEGKYTNTPDLCMWSAIEYLMAKTPRDYKTALPYLHCYFDEEVYGANEQKDAEMAQYLADYYRQTGDSRSAGIWEYNREVFKHNARVNAQKAALKKAEKFNGYVTMDEYHRLSSLESEVEFSAKQLAGQRKELESQEQDG